MGLNIKNERVCALARRAAELTGKTQTSAIEEALQRLIDQHEKEVRWAEAERLLKEIHEGLPPDVRGKHFSTDFLYDDDGLPA